MQLCCLGQLIGNILVVILDVGGIDIYILGDIKTHLYQYHYNFGSEIGWRPDANANGLDYDLKLVIHT